MSVFSFRTLSFRRFLPVLFVMLMGVLGLTPSPVAAHNSLIESDPKEGAVLVSAPPIWTLTFKNDVPLSSASGEIIDSAGIRIELPAPRFGANQKQIVFSLPTELTGNVTARWRLVNTDGHVVSARVKFTIGTPTKPTTGADVSNSIPVSPSAGEVSDDTDGSTPGVVRFSLRLGGYLAVLAYGGLVVSLLLVGPGLWSFPRMRTLALAASSVLALVPLAQFMVFAGDVTVGGSSGSFLDAADSTAGSMLLLRTVVGATIMAVVLKRGSLGSGTSHALSILYLITLAYVGHSRSMAWPLVGVPVDVIHSAAAASWLGGLAVLVLLVLPNLTPEDSLSVFRRFGTIAQRAVLLIVVTGIIQTLRLHTTLITLVTQSHGRWLILKLIAVAGMLKIGDMNRKRIMRTLQENDTMLNRRVAILRRASLTEIATGGIVILVTTVLVTSSLG